MPKRFFTMIVVISCLLMIIVVGPSMASIRNVPGLTAIGLTSIDISSLTSIQSGDGGGPGNSVPPVTIQDTPPDRWVAGNRTGIYYDPLSKTTWSFDRILKKFFCADKGWYLITQYSETYPPRVINRFYYDPHLVTFYDFNTGAPIDPNTMEAKNLPSVTTAPSVKPTLTPPVTQIITGDSCLVTCPDCPNGYCHDCNQNHICDETESLQNVNGPGGQSENPQDLIQPVPMATSQGSGGQSENPQVNPQPTQTLQSEGGLSESAQAPVLAMLKLPGSQWTNENTDPVINKPKNPTLINFESDIVILSISTYHWNNGKGIQHVGTIALKDPNGKQYGPWQAIGEKSEDGVTNAVWKVSFAVESGKNPLNLNKGTYTVIDSDTQTWSNNEKSDFQGFCTVQYGKNLNPNPNLNLPNVSQKLTLNNLKIEGINP